MSDGGIYEGPGGQRLHGSGKPVAEPPMTPAEEPREHWTVVLERVLGNLALENGPPSDVGPEEWYARINDRIQHFRNCAYPDDCYCFYRRKLAALTIDRDNWRELHNAWRKRAEEAEAEMLRTPSGRGRVNEAAQKVLDAWNRTEMSAPPYDGFIRRSGPATHAFIEELGNLYSALHNIPPTTSPGRTP